MSMIRLHGVIIDQTMNINVTHAAMALTLHWHLGLFIAKHLKYFKMEIEFTPLGIFDERILAGNQSAYQIDGVAGSCYRS